MLVSILGSCAITGRAPAHAPAPGVEAPDRRVETFWPNGRLRQTIEYLGDVRHGEYRTWSVDGRPYELKHYEYGREAGLQQAWDETGTLYLNYEVRNGRRYGLVNARPCLPAAADGTSDRNPARKEI